MVCSRAELTSRLAALDAAIPQLRTQCSDNREFWNALSEKMDFTAECAGTSDFDWVNTAIDDLLRKHGVDVRPDEPPA